MLSSFVTPTDPPRAGISKLTYFSHFNKDVSELHAKVPSAERPSTEPLFLNPARYPQSPTLSTPDTPTTAESTSPGPWTPITPYFGPLYPVHPHTDNGEENNVPVSPKNSLSPVARVDPHDDDEEDEGQELIILEPRAGIHPPLQLHFSPPRPSAISATRLNVQKNSTSFTSTHATEHFHQQASDYRKSEGVNAYKSNDFSLSAVTIGDSFEASMFEILTPTQEDDTSNLIGPALGESTCSAISPLPNDTTPPRAVSRLAYRSPLTSIASDKCTSNSSERPFGLRRHRPLHVSISHDLNNLVRRFHVLQGFLRHRDNHAAAVPGPRPFHESPSPGRHVYERPSSHDRTTFEGFTHGRSLTMSTLRSANPPAGMWFPPSGSDSPIRFFADSPVPMTPSPPPPDESLRRHHPASMRSISPMHFGDSVAALQEQSLDSTDSVLQEVRGRGSELFFPLPPTRRHRRQLAVSVSFQALDASESDFGTGRKSRSLSPHTSQHFDSPQTSYNRRDRLPDWATRPDMSVSVLRSDSEINVGQDERGAVATQRKMGKFWKTISNNASALFARKSKQASDFEVPAPHKRILPSLGGLFRLRGPTLRPRRRAVPEVARLEVWPSLHRRTSSCSDPTCFFHPKPQAPSLAAMSFATITSPKPEFEVDLGDTDRSYLAGIVNWGLDRPPSAWRSGNSPTGSQSVSIGASGSSVCEEGEKVPEDICGMPAGGGLRGKNKSSRAPKCD